MIYKQKILKLVKINLINDNIELLLNIKTKDGKNV